MPNNQYALKEFDGAKACRNCNIEAHTNKLLAYAQSGRNIIRFYGGYKHSNGQSACMILEYANGGTLESYMEKTPPPITTKGRRDFLTSFWALSIALTKIHNMQVEDQRYE